MFSDLIIGTQRTIKLKEYLKGLYRYPNKMIGRNISHINKNNTDVLVFAAHPDDELLGLSSLINKHFLKGEKIIVVYVTDGSGRDGESWKKERPISERNAKVRYQEGILGLSILKIPAKNILCLGFPDGGTHRYLKEMSKDVYMLIKRLSPKQIYVHCIEGGHNDHDLVSLVVKSVCNKLNFSNIFEWAEYNSLYPLGSKKIDFLPSLPFHSRNAVRNINLSEIELKNKRKMLSCHVSQKVDDVYSCNEIIRKADIRHLKDELIAYSQVSREEWFPMIEKFLSYMKLNHLQIHNDPYKLEDQNVKKYEHVN